MNPIAAANAKKIIEKYNLKTPDQYPLEKILNAEGLLLEEAPLEGCIGSIVFSEKHGIVTISNIIKEEAQKRFTMAHEFGHFENERCSLTPPDLPFEKGEEKNYKARGVRVCEYEDVMSITKNKTNEVNANIFASELLIPCEWLKKFVKGKKLNPGLLKDTANYFNVSLSSASIKLAESDLKPCGVIMTAGGIVKWHCISESFRYQFIRNGSTISELSYTHDYYNNKDFPINGEDVPARAWFREDFTLKEDDRIYEVIIPMHSYNSALAILWAI